MQTKTITLISLVVASFFLAGCVDRGRAQMGPKEANLLGIATYEKGAYSNTGALTAAVSTDELYPRRNVSGDKATFLWGLFTIKDY